MDIFTLYSPDSRMNENKKTKMTQITELFHSTHEVTKNNCNVAEQNVAKQSMNEKAI